MAGLFGLVHELAFVNGLALMKLDGHTKILGLLGFNLGIEMAQWVVMFVSFPLLYMSRYPFYHLVRCILAVGTMAAALYWVVQRAAA